MAAVLARLSRAWAAFRGFEGAQHSPQHLRRPIGSQQSPDAAMQEAHTSLTEWGRYLDENHDIAVGVLDNLVTNIVGTGIEILPAPRIGGRVNVDLADAIAEAWDDWARSPEVTGELPWGELQRLTCRAWLRDGEVFTQHVGANASYPWAEGEVRYRLEFLESAMVDFNQFTPTDTDRTRQGVILDEWGRPLAYKVYLRNPYDYTSLLGGTGRAGDMFATKIVSAERLMHLKFVRRWPQTRGQPILHSVIRRLQDIKHYEDSERIAARVAADMCAYIRKSPENVYETKDDAFDNRPSRMQAGRIYDDLMPGEEIGTISHDRPNTSLGEYRNQMLRAVSAGTGTSYSSISKDYDGSYSSQRQELVEARPHYLRLRNYFVAKYIRPVYERWLRTANLQGVLSAIPAGTPFTDLRRAEFIGPGMPWIDPLKEIQAYQLAREENLMTREQIIVELGRNPRDVPVEALREPATVLEVVENAEDEDQPNTGTA